VVFTRNEVKLVLAPLDGTPHLIASLLYDSGLRLMEAVRLRVKDIDFERHELTIRQGKGAKESRLGQCLRRASREEIQLDADPGVARETRLPQATLCHAFSVKMRARRPRSQF
jgi:integrase